jgi:hypothetical protein
MWIIDEDNEQPFSDFEHLIEMKESEDINVFDLAGTLDARYSDLLIYSDFIVIPLSIQMFCKIYAGFYQFSGIAGKPGRTNIHPI